MLSSARTVRHLLSRAYGELWSNLPSKLELGFQKASTFPFRRRVLVDLTVVSDRVRFEAEPPERKRPVCNPSPQLTSVKPEIIQVPSLHLLGLSVRLNLPVSSAAGNRDVIPNLYERFHLIFHCLPLQQDKYIYGAARSPLSSKQPNPGELEYLASINVDSGVEPKKPLELWSIPAATYACFTHHGPLTKLSETIDYAFGTWLPRSSYVPSDGPTLDRQDERFGYGGKDSEFDFLVPVRPK